MLPLVYFHVIAGLLSTAGSLPAQDQTAPRPNAETAPPSPPAAPERWNLFYQATSIGDYHGRFHSPYDGAFSLQDHPERDVSLTTTLFFALRLADEFHAGIRPGNRRRPRIQRREWPGEPG